MFSEMWRYFRQAIKNPSVCFPDFWRPEAKWLLVWEGNKSSSTAEEWGVIGSQSPSYQSVHMSMTEVLKTGYSTTSGL